MRQRAEVEADGILKKAWKGIDNAGEGIYYNLQARIFWGD